MKIYDIFTFFNELELLELRFNILDSYVDYFVIVEATETFSGLPKPLYFEENKHLFEKWKHKIIHHVVDDYPSDKAICAMADLSPNVPKHGAQHWHREFYQKESIKKALTGLQNDDLCFVGDADEIWNYNKTYSLQDNDVFKLKLKVYSYFLNNRSNEEFAGTIVTKYRNIKNNCLNHLRARNIKYLNDGGWHFTNMGGIDRVREKLNASNTGESYNTPDVQSKLAERIYANKDYIGRDFKFWIDERELPPYLLTHRQRYAHLFKPINRSADHVTPTIIMKLSGGLGNQLFQYATSRALALCNETDIKLDPSAYERAESNITPRRYMLNHFNVRARFASSAEISRCKHISEHSFRYDPKILMLRDDVHLTGYWQSPLYFECIRDILQKETTLKAPLSIGAQIIAEKIQRDNAVSLHVRRGDYVSDAKTNQFHGTCSLEYYQDAINALCQRVYQPMFYVFSDDIAWVKSHLPMPADRVCYVSNPQLPDYEELILMTYCQHHIIANSSFSWWGAWLNLRHDPIIIAPKKWFSNQTINTDDLLPTRWITL